MEDSQYVVNAGRDIKHEIDGKTGLKIGEMQEISLTQDVIPTVLIEDRKCTVHEWALKNKNQVEQILRTQGALLIRNLNIPSSKQFAKILTTLFDADLLEYIYRSTPRTELRDNIYTATEYHREQLIQQHNENSYSNVWPTRIGFWCMLPSDTGGETPIADSRNVYSLLPREIREEFEMKGVMYVRNYSNIDLPWQEVFQSNDPKEVERYCMENRLKFEWRGDDHLRTVQVNAATQIHPFSAEPIWFNQAHLFHERSLADDVREGLRLSLDSEDLPRNAFYGDGTKIDDEIIDVIIRSYERCKLTFSLEKGDLLLLDNMLFSHGRNPYVGDRKVLVGMARPSVAATHSTFATAA